MPSRAIQVTSAVHVRSFYHLLSHFDLGGGPTCCYNPAYVHQLRAARPADLPPLGRHLGRLHARLRAAPGRDALPGLPVPFLTGSAFHAAAQSLVDQTAPPPDLSAATRRAIAPLADPAGARLVRQVLDLIATERRQLLDAYYQRHPEPGAGLQSYLQERLPPVTDALFGDTHYRLVILPAEALSARAFAARPAPKTFHIAVPPTFRDAFFHILYALSQHRVARLVRDQLPEAARQNRAHPMRAQLLVDAAMTCAYHLLLRQRPADIAAFETWAIPVFRASARPPGPAVEALKPMALLPEEAIPALHAIFGEPEL